MSIKRLTHPKENPYFILALSFSILLVIALALSIVEIFYVVFFGAIFLVSNGLLIGSLRGNSIRVTREQFPDLYMMAEDLSRRLEMKSVPEIYLLQEGGTLNAFAIRFFARDFVAIYSSVLELAYKEGNEAVKFVVAHELAHVALGHTKKQAWIAPAMFIPFIGTAYKRACEYSADAVGAGVVPTGAVDSASWPPAICFQNT